MAVERFLPSAIAHFEPADLIGALATGILVLDSDLCVVYANVAAQDLLAVSVNQARGKPFLSLVLEADSLQRTDAARARHRRNRVRARAVGDAPVRWDANGASST